VQGVCTVGRTSQHSLWSGAVPVTSGPHVVQQLADDRVKLLEAALSIPTLLHSRILAAETCHCSLLLSAAAEQGAKCGHCRWSEVLQGDYRRP
jgi:hypothetical protein